jgi:hypothetical protein
MTIFRFNGSDFSVPIDAIRPDDPRRVLQLPPEAIAEGLEQNPK